MSLKFHQARFMLEQSQTQYGSNLEAQIQFKLLKSIQNLICIAYVEG